MKKMVAKTFEGLARKLKIEGFPEYANELRFLIRIYNHKERAYWGLWNVKLSLLISILEYVALKENRHKTDVRLCEIDIRNRDKNNRPWFSIREIEYELNYELINPSFAHYLKIQLKLDGYSTKDITKIVSLLESKKTLKALGIKLYYDSENNLQIVTRKNQSLRNW